VADTVRTSQTWNFALTNRLALSLFFVVSARGELELISWFFLCLVLGRNRRSLATYPTTTKKVRLWLTSKWRPCKFVIFPFKNF